MCLARMRYFPIIQPPPITRPMARVIQDKIKRPLADELLFGKLVNGGRVSIDVRDDELVVETQAEPERLLPVTVD